MLAWLHYAIAPDFYKANKKHWAHCRVCETSLKWLFVFVTWYIIMLAIRKYVNCGVCNVFFFCLKNCDSLDFFFIALFWLNPKDWCVLKCQKLKQPNLYHHTIKTSPKITKITFSILKMVEVNNTQSCRPVLYVHDFMH